MQALSYEAWDLQSKPWPRPPARTLIKLVLPEPYRGDPATLLGEVRSWDVHRMDSLMTPLLKQPSQ